MTGSPDVILKALLGVKRAQGKGAAGHPLAASTVAGHGNKRLRPDLELHPTASTITSLVQLYVCHWGHRCHLYQR